MWQQSVRGRGCDCRGLIIGIAREVGLPEASSLIARRRNYGHDFTPGEMIAGLEAAMRRIKVAQPGDILAIEIGKPPMPRHLAMLTEPGRLIHSYGGGLSKVVEVPLGHSRRIHSIWTWPSLQGA